MRVQSLDARALYARIRPPATADVQAELDALDRADHKRANNPRPITFQQAAEKYLSESHQHASIGRKTYAVSRLLPFIGQMPIDEIREASLYPFIKSRLEDDDVARKTVRASVAEVWTILRSAARKWRHSDGTPWLATVPLIRVDALAGYPAQTADARQPYALSRDEQDLLLAALPAEPQRQMAEFVLNTGTLEHEVCSLRWEWEALAPATGVPVFLIPHRFNATKRKRLLVLNQTARRILNERRNVHPEFVFSWKRFRPKHVGEPDPREGQPLQSMNNTAWQSARAAAALAYANKYGTPAPLGFARVRVWDLRHTFTYRLREAAVHESIVQTLLGQVGNGGARTAPSAAQIEELLLAVDKIDTCDSAL